MLHQHIANAAQHIVSLGQLFDEKDTHLIFYVSLYDPISFLFQIDEHGL